MANDDLSEAGRRERMKRVFEIIVQYKESDTPGNLNKIFESYGTSTLEAQVPIVDQEVAERVTECSDLQQTYATMALKTIAAKDAMKGRPPRTKNRELRTIEVGGTTLLTCGNTRDRSPIDKAALDSDLNEIEQARDRYLAGKSGRTSPERFGFEPKVEISSPRVKIEPSIRTRPLPPRAKFVNSFPRPFCKREEDVLSEQHLNEKIDEYMQEAARRKAQRNILSEQSDVARTREMFEKEAGLDFSNIPMDDL